MKTRLTYYTILYFKVNATTKMYKKILTFTLPLSKCSHLSSRICGSNLNRAQHCVINARVNPCCWLFAPDSYGYNLTSYSRNSTSL